MKQKPKSVEEYIDAFSPDIQTRLKLIRDIIIKIVPDAEVSIRYGMPAFKLQKEHIYFSAYKKHIGMYPMYGLPGLEEELKLYRAKDTKDAIHFMHAKELPIKLIERIVKAKVKRQLE